NPVDCGGPPVGDERGFKILEAIVADPRVGALIVPIAGAVDLFNVGLSRDLPAIAKTTDKPIFTIWGAPPGTDDTYYYKLLDGGLHVFRTFGNCVPAVKAYMDYWAFVRRYRSPFLDAPRTPSPSAARAKKVLLDAARGSTLSEHASKQVLKAYGIRTSRDELCTSAAEAVRAAKRLGYPVVMKPSAGALSHKSDLGLVRVGVSSDKEVRDTFADLDRRARRAVGRSHD